MATFTHTHLFVGAERAVVMSGLHIQVLDSSTGEILASTNSLDNADREAVVKSGAIRCCALDKIGKYLATSGEDKLLKVWAVDDLTLLSQRELPKKPTAILFTKSDQQILVSDKFGDIFSYALHPKPPKPLQVIDDPQTSKRDNNLSSHENPSDGQLVLGHASVLTDFLLSPDERYIISADRDEHIRVSWFPQGYNIEMYCLGHKKFVSAIHIPEFAPSSLISGGGDPMLKIWDWMKGVVTQEIPVAETIEPFIKVRTVRKRVEDGEEERFEGTSKGRKERKGKKKLEAGTSNESPEGPESEESKSKKAKTSGDVVLAIQKIDTLEAADGENYIVFSAHGASALFTCRYPSFGTVPEVYSVDLQKPILNFYISSDKIIWVLVDTAWSEAGPTDRADLVRTFAFVAGKVEEVNEKPQLRESLNSNALLSATEVELSELDLYSPLSSLPKKNEFDNETAEALDLTEVPDKALEEMQVTKKTLGRLKNKRALIATVNAKNEGSEAPEIKKSKTQSIEDVDVDVSMNEH